MDSATLQDEQPLPLDTNTPVLESPPSEHISRPEELGSVPLGAAALPESSVPADSGALLRLQAEVKTLRAQLEASLVALQWSQAASARLAAEAQGLQGLADGRFSLELEVAELHAELDEERGARGALQDELARARAQLEDLKKETELLASVSVAAPPFATVGVRNPLYESPRGEGFGGGFAEGRPHFDSAVIRSEASSVAEALARDPDVLGRDLNSSVGGSDVLMSGSDALSGNPDALARAADGPARDLDASTRVSNALAGAADGLTRDLDGGAARSLSESSLVRTSEDAEGWLVGEGNLPSERISECFTVQYEPVEDSLFLPGETEQLATGEGHLVVKLATSGAREVLESRRKSLSVVMPTAQEWAFGATPRLNPLFGIEGELFSPLELPKRSQSMTDAVYLHQAGERAGAQCELDRIRNLEKLCFSRGEEVAALRTLLEESQRGAHEGAELRAETERMAAELTWLQALLRRKEEQLAAMAVEKLVNASIEKAAEAGETGGGSAETEVQSGGELVGREEPVDGESNGTEMQRQTEECGAEGGDEEQLSRAASLEVDFLVADFVTGGRSEEESFPVNVETSSQENETVIGAVAGPSEIDKNGVFDGEGSVGEAPDAPASVYVESSSPQDKSVVGGAAAPDGAEEDVVYHVKWSVGERPDALDSVVPPAEAEPETEHGVFAAEPGPGGTELLLLRIDQLKRERDAAVRRARDLEAEGLVDQIDLRVKGAVLEKAAGLVARLREAHAQKRETKGEVTTEGGVRAEKAQLDPNQESGPRKGPEATGKVRERRASAVEEEGRHVALWQAAGKLRCLKEQNEELLRTRPSAHGRLSDASGRTSDVVKRNTESAGRQPDAIGRFADAVESILEPREGSELERGLPVLGPAKTGDYQEVEVVRPEALRTEGGGRKNQNCSGAEELQEQVLLDGELMGALEGLAVEKSAEGKESKIPGAEELSDDVALLEKLKSSRVESRRKKEKLLALREELGSVNSLITERGFAKTDLVVEAGALQMGQVLAAYQQTVEDNQNLDVALGAVREELLLAREALAETFAGESEMSAQKPGSESASDVSESARDLSGELEALLAECARKRGKLRATREDLTDLCKASESSPHLVAEVRSSPVADVEEVQRLSLEIGVRLEERKVLEEAFNSATEELIHARAALADGFAADGNGGGLEGLDEETKNLVTRLADLTEACEQKARKIGAIHRELKEVQELREGVAGHSAPGAESRTANGSGTELERLSAAVEQKQLEARELDERLGAAREELLSARALLAVRFECHVEAGAARGEVDYLTGRLAGVTIECAKKSGMVRVLREELADVMLASVPVTEDEKGEGEGLPTGERERLSELRELRAREKSELQEQLVSVTEQLSQARDAFAAKQRENMPGTRSEEESRSEQRVDANLFEQLSIRLEERSVECARKAGQLRALREELEEARKAVGGTAGGWSGKSAGENGGRSFVTAESFKALSAAFEEKVREEIVLDTSIRAAREGVLSARNATAETFAGQADGEVPKEEGRSVEEFKELSARLEARSLECARKEEKLRVLRAELEEVTGEVGRILRAPLEESSIGESGRGSVDREQFETVSGALEQKTEEARMLDDRIDSVLEELIKARETLAETFANGFKGQCPVKQRRVSGQIFEEVSARLEAQSVECAGKGEKLRTLEAELADVRGLVSDTYSEQPFGGERERSDGEEEGKQVPSEKEASSAGTLNRNAGTTDQAALSGASGQALSLPAQDGLVTPLGDSGGAEDDDADVLCGVSSLLTSSAEAEGQDACPSDSHNETPAHETQPDADSNGPRSSDVRPGTETPAHEFSSNTQSEGPCSSEVRPGEDSQSPRAKPETRWDEAFTAEAYREKAAECSGYQEELRAVKEELQATRKSLTQFYEEIQIFTGQEIEEVIGGAGVEAVRKAVRRASVNVLRVAEAARLQGAEVRFGELEIWGSFSMSLALLRAVIFASRVLWYKKLLCLCRLECYRLSWMLNKNTLFYQN